MGGVKTMAKKQFVARILCSHTNEFGVGIADSIKSAMAKADQECFEPTGGFDICLPVDGRKQPKWLWISDSDSYKLSEEELQQKLFQFLEE